MLIVNLDEARAGMMLAAPVAHPENPQHDLLKRGYCLEANMIPRLRDLGVSALYVDYPGLEDLDAQLAPLLSPERQAVYQQIRATMIQSQKRTSAGVSFSDYNATTREMITTLMDQGSHPIYMERMSGMGTDAVAHATTVAHLSLLLGLRMEMYLIQQRARLSAAHAREVVNLGVAAMLHDIGKTKLPESLREKCEIDTLEEGVDAPTPAKSELREQWESHTRLGYDMIRGGVECSAAAAVLHHHQHYDGTGFPAPLPASEIAGKPASRMPPPTSPRGAGIHVFARILFVTDLYANLSRPPGSDVRRGNLEVLHLMRTRYAQWIDPAIFRTLQTVSPPFLPGSKVILSDHTVAAVVQVKPTDPYAPIVRRFKPDGMELESTSIDLHDRNAPRLLALPGGQKIADFLPPSAASADSTNSTRAA